MFSIYRLLDPRTQLVRYIGISGNVEIRYITHLRNNDRSNKSKRGWIEELKQNGLAPILEVIETVTGIEQARERELYWMKHYLAEGMPLLNVSGVIRRWTGNFKQKKIETVPPKPVLDELLTAKEVARILHRHPYTVKRQMREGKIPAHLIGGAYRIKREDLNRYIEERKIKTDQTE